MDELIYSVREVFSSFLLKEQAGYYNIPEYQRGYKWNEANIVALLNDIEKFRQETGNAEATFYCLQNITLVKNTNANCFHVVDGQQRLTTLLILLSFLQHETDSTPLLLENKLQYSIRPETHEFITKQVLTGHIWERRRSPNGKTSIISGKLPGASRHGLKKTPQQTKVNFWKSCYPGSN